MVKGTASTDHAIGDIRRLRATHTDQAIRLRVRFEELKRVGDCLGVSASVRSDRTKERGYDEGFYVNAGPRCDDPGTGTWQLLWIELDSYFESGPSAVADYAENTFTIRIPRKALDDPRWVRVDLGHSSHWTARGRNFRDSHDLGWTPRLHTGDG